MAKTDPPPQEEKPLTAKEEAFCRNYVISWNGSQAARDAGYSKKTARFIASQNLTKLNIRARIKELMAEKLMEQEEVLARLADMARSNMAELVELYDEPIVDKRGKQIGYRQVPRLIPEMFQRYGHLIKSIKPAATGGYSVELYSAKEALDMIGKYYSLFIDKDKEGNPIQPVVNVYMPDNNRK